MSTPRARKAEIEYGSLPPQNCVDFFTRGAYNGGMFGYVLADREGLNPQQLSRYQGCYCGLCRRIGRGCGQVCRLSLTYDMTFLALLLGSLYEPPEREEARPCPLHPFRKKRSWESEATAYAADMNVILARLNCLDDWTDDRRLLRLGEAALLRRGAEKAMARQEDKCRVIRDCLRELRDVEERRDPSPDPGASAFGRLMGELLVWRRDRWEETLRRAGEHLGRFIYLTDALLDLEADRRRGLYNPLTGIMAEGADREEVLDILVNQISACAAWVDRLPLVRDAELLRNILYQGVWQAFGRKEDQKHESS